jgi:hypothetical protein
MIVDTRASVGRGSPHGSCVGRPPIEVIVMSNVLD